MQEKVDVRGYGQGKKITKEKIKESEGDTHRPNQRKAKNAENVENSRYDEVLRKNNRHKHDQDDHRAVKDQTSRKIKYRESIIDDEKTYKSISKNKGHPKKRKSKNDTLVSRATEIVLDEKIHEASEENIGAESVEDMMIAARYAHRIVDTQIYGIKSTGEQIRNANNKYGNKNADNVKYEEKRRKRQDVSTTQEDLSRQQFRVEKKYKEAKQDGKSLNEAIQDTKEFIIKMLIRHRNLLQGTGIL